MKFEKIGNVCVVRGEGECISNAREAMDMMFSAKWETNCERIAIGKENLCEEFFILSTGLAGEILQKFINYHMKVAIFGDFSRYTSKPLHDFIYECNNGRDVFFVASKEEAVARLAQA